MAKRTHRPEVMAGLGGFGSLFQLPVDRYREPVLVAGTDGVGTKLKVAHLVGRHNTIGIDLVAMCVNDIIVTGAEPLFFLDYFATARLQVDQAKSVIEGIAQGCEQAGAALVGGETAEMPGMYSGDDYDLAGFCVGVVERDAIIDGSHVQPGDKVVGLASSGLHSNGYSLVRQVLADSGQSLSEHLNPSDPTSPNLGDTLLEPTRIYVKPVLAVLEKIPLHAIAHITGGGLGENIARVLPDTCDAQLDAAAWSMPTVFNWLQSAGNIADEEMWRTFNCGIGLAVIVGADKCDDTVTAFAEQQVDACVIGEVTAGRGQVMVRAKPSS